MTQPDPPYISPAPDQAIPVDLSKRPKAPSDSELAARWIMYNRQAAFGLGEWRKYKNGIWPPIDKDLIKKDIKAILDKANAEGIKTTSGLLSSVMELTRVEVAIENSRWDAHPDFLPCRNGVLDIPTKTLLPHNPDIFATSQLSYDYDPAATCPAFLQALQQIPDAADFLQEFAGYALTPDVRHETAVWMQGTPGSGKSTILEGLQAMLGERAGLLGLADLERSRFALSQLPGKTLVVSAEQPDNYIGASHILNALISGEPLRIEEKYKEAITITPRVKIIWAMNNLPRVNDSNNGIMRRVKVVKFPPLSESQRDPTLKERIKLEGAGILNWALEGLARLLARGKFIIPQSVEDATKEFKERNDIPSIFLEEIGARIDPLDPHCRTQSQYLYDQYKNWCISNCHKPMSSTKMAEEWKRLGFEKARITGIAYWVGVEITAFSSASNVP